MNNYFETIDSTYLNDYKITDSIEINKSQNINIIWYPINQFKFYTKSNFVISTKIRSHYGIKNLYIKINKKGIISIK